MTVTTRPKKRRRILEMDRDGLLKDNHVPHPLWGGRGQPVAPFMKDKHPTGG